MLTNSLIRSQFVMNNLLGVAPTMGFASKIMGGSTSNKKDSAGRRLGLKKWGENAEVFENDIIARQRGTKWAPGFHIKTGLDYTLHAKVEVSLNQPI